MTDLRLPADLVAFLQAGPARTLDAGGYVGLDDRAMWLIGVVAAVLALVTVVVLLADA